MKIRGVVAKGSGIARTLGVPTANIPAHGIENMRGGVYAAVVEYGGKRYGALANLGVKPTFGDAAERVLELHLLDFTGDLYGQELTAELLEFVRPERKFASTDALRRQIEQDRKNIITILKQRKCI